MGGSWHRPSLLAASVGFSVLGVLVWPGGMLGYPSSQSSTSSAVWLSTRRSARAFSAAWAMGACVVLVAMRRIAMSWASTLSQLRMVAGLVVGAGCSPGSWSVVPRLGTLRGQVALPPGRFAVVCRLCLVGCCLVVG